MEEDDAEPPMGLRVDARLQQDQRFYEDIPTPRRRTTRSRRRVDTAQDE